MPVIPGTEEEVAMKETKTYKGWRKTRSASVSHFMGKKDWDTPCWKEVEEATGRKATGAGNQGAGIDKRLGQRWPDRWIREKLNFSHSLWKWKELG